MAIPILWQICLAIDALIYNIATQIIHVFFEVALISTNVSALSEDLNFVIGRVMMLSGVVALFALSVYLITSMTNPTTDSKNGNGQKYLQNIIIAVVLLASSTFIFDILNNLYAAVINNNVIPKIVYGDWEEHEYGNEGPDMGNIDEMASEFINGSFLTAFFRPTDGNNCEGSSTAWCTTYNRVKAGNGTLMDLIPYASDTIRFTYTPFISGIFGIVMCYYFFRYTIELATRVFRLLLLQVLSPIPFIISIIPQQHNRLTTFWTVYFQNYVQAFVRILTVYMAFMLFGLVTTNGSMAVTGALLLDISGFAKILLCIGLFHACQELPRLVDQILGTHFGGKPDGNFGLRAVLGATIGGLVGMAGGAIAGGVTGGAGGAVLGAATGLANGGFAGSRGTLFAAGRGVAASVAHAGRLGTAVRDIGLGGFLLGKADRLTGGEYREKRRTEELEKQKTEIGKGLSKANKGKSSLDNIKQAYDAEFDKKNTTSREDFLKGDAKLSALQAEHDANLEAGLYSGDSGLEREKYDLDVIKARRSFLSSMYDQQRKISQEQFMRAGLDKNVALDNAKHRFASLDSYIADDSRYKKLTSQLNVATTDEERSRITSDIEARRNALTAEYGERQHLSSFDTYLRNKGIDSSTLSDEARNNYQRAYNDALLSEEFRQGYKSFDDFKYENSEYTKLKAKIDRGEYASAADLAYDTDRLKAMGDELQEFYNAQYTQENGDWLTRINSAEPEVGAIREAKEEYESFRQRYGYDGEDNRSAASYDQYTASKDKYKKEAKQYNRQTEAIDIQLDEIRTSEGHKRREVANKDKFMRNH